DAAESRKVKCSSELRVCLRQIRQTAIADGCRLVPRATRERPHHSGRAASRRRGRQESLPRLVPGRACCSPRAGQACATLFASGDFYAGRRSLWFSMSDYISQKADNVKMSDRTSCYNSKNKVL